MSRAVLTFLADVQPLKVDWLWESRIPLGMLTIFDGDPGLGKSTILLDLAARLSRGDAMPDGTAGPGAAGTVILTAEDDLARVVRPRLDVAGADLNRIATVSVKDRDGEREPSVTADDLPMVEEAIRSVGGMLVIIDPLMAYLPSDVNSNRDQDVRRALVRLRDLGGRTGAAIVVVRHLNKGVGGPALYRGGGSIGIIGAARSGLLLAADPAAPDSGRVLAVTKSNLAAKAPSLRLQLIQAGHDFPGVRWGGTCDLSAAQLLSAGEKPERRGPRDAAISLLRELLAEGPVPQQEVLLRATELGISAETLKRARRDLEVASRKVGRPSEAGQHWVWSLPQADGSEGEDGRDGGDPLRDCDPPLEGGHSAKTVTPDSDLLREESGGSAPKAPTFLKEVTSGGDLFPEASGGDARTSLLSSKGVTSGVDPLREKARGLRARVLRPSEEGHHGGIEPLLDQRGVNQSDQTTDVCPLCGGPTLSWSWGIACTRCHNRIPDDAVAVRSAHELEAERAHG